MKGHALGALSAFCGAGNVNALSIGANNVKSSRLRVNRQNSPRLQSVTQSLHARNLGFGHSGDVAGENSRTRDGTQESHSFLYGESPRFVPGIALVPAPCLNPLPFYWQ